MGKKTALNWGATFRAQLALKGSSLGKVAEAIGRAESTVRSWTNGTREINLAEFLELCAAAEIDPAVVLFADQVDEKFLAVGEAWRQADTLGREVLWTAAQGILAKRGVDKPQGAKAAVGRRAGGRTRL